MVSDPDKHTHTALCQSDRGRREVAKKKQRTTTKEKDSKLRREKLRKQKEGKKSRTQ